ncbi:MAG: hypothetical protein ACI4NM_00600 [Bullifex sp.]
MNKHKISIVLLALLLVGMLMSCSNKTPGASAVGLNVGRVGTVFADPGYKYDIAYKNGSTRYIADVTVSLSNGSYKYPSSVKGELLKLNGSDWVSVQNNITGQIVFTESGTYKVKYTADGFTADTGEFPVYKPGELYDFSATKSAYAAGAQMTRLDFTYTYCYKDESGSIAVTNSVPNRDVSIYTRDEQLTFVTLLDDQDTYKYADKVIAGILIESPENPEGFVNMEIEITVLNNCTSDIKSSAYYKPKSGSTDTYEFSGYIYRKFYNDEGKNIGSVKILSKTDDGAKITDEYKIKISAFIPSEDTLTPAQLLEEYKKVTLWNDASEGTFVEQSFTGSGYLLLKITEESTELTANNPAYIRVRKRV